MKFIVGLALCVAFVMAELKVFKIAEPYYIQVKCKNSTIYKNCECPNEQFNLHCMIALHKKGEKPVCISNSTLFHVLPNCIKNSPKLRNEDDSFSNDTSTTISNEDMDWWPTGEDDSDVDSNRYVNNNSSDSDGSSDSDSGSDSSGTSNESSTIGNYNKR